MIYAAATHRRAIKICWLHCVELSCRELFCFTVTGCDEKSGGQSPALWRSSRLWVLKQFVTANKAMKLILVIKRDKLEFRR